MAKQYKIYQIYWDYECGNDYRSHPEKGKVLYIDTSSENALKRFKKTPEYEYHHKMIEIYHPTENIIKVKEVSKIYASLPQLNYEDAEKFSIDFKAVKKGKSVTLELKVKEK